MPFKLKKKVAKLEEVPEQARGLYVKAGEEFVLDGELEGYVPAEKVSEFRDGNIELRKQVETLVEAAKQWEGMTREEYQKALEAKRKMEELEEQGLMKDGKITEVVDRRVAAVREDYTKQVNELKNYNKSLEDKYNKTRQSYNAVRIETETDRLLDKLGLVPKPGAKSDIYRRAREAWEVQDDDTLRGKGVFNNKGEDASFDEWGQRLLQDAPFLFDGSSGGGARGGHREKQQAGKKIIPANDPVAFGANVDAIARGDAVVEGTSSGD